MNFKFPVERAALDNRLNLDCWLEEFDTHWNRLSSQYFQYERLQDYQEPSNPSYRAFREGDIPQAKVAVRNAVAEDIPDYRHLCQNGIPYTRIHAVELPLTAYLKWEFLMYDVLCQLGQRIMICDLSSEHGTDSILDSYDFLMFDDAAVLVQDYGSNGLLCGGWVIENQNIVERFRQFSQLLTRSSLPYGEFLISHPSGTDAVTA